MLSSTGVNKLEKITIMIADDHPLLRQALRYILEGEPDFDIIAEVSDGEQALAYAAEMTPEVVIMDINMPVLNGLEATRKIKAQCPDTKIIALTVYDDSEHILSILEAGAVGYLTKRVFGHEVVQAVRTVVSGDTVLSPDVSRRVIKHALHHIAKPVPADIDKKLTGRDLQILEMIAKGYPNKDIASRLGLTPSTVKSYLTEIFSKLGASSRTDAVITVLRSGLLNIEDLE